MFCCECGTKLSLIDSMIYVCTFILKNHNFHIYTSFQKTLSNKLFIVSTPSKSPSGGVKNFFVFRKDFMNPYLPANDASSFTYQLTGARLLQMNCECLRRSNIAFSDFVHTLLAKTEYLEKNISVLDGMGIAKFFHKMENYKDALRVLNPKSDAQSNNYLL